VSREEHFWSNPPWRQAKAKYRLGLVPTTWESWAVEDESLLRNKRTVLEQHYQQAVAVVEEDSHSIDLALEELPLSSTVSNKYPHKIANIAWGFPEDICVIDILDQQRLVAGCVCAPSYWNLLEKLGKPLHAVHAPVDGMNKKIGANIERVIERMPRQKPFCRQNWFVHADHSYFGVKHQDIPSKVDCHWYIRSEQQLLVKVSERYLVFFIRVVFQPLLKLGRHPVARGQLIKALQHMDADEIRYFGGATKHQSLINYLTTIVGEVS